MKRFLLEAKKLGFNGYCCFKVGASGCANGMWVFTKNSETGHSPDDCSTLYKSFTPDINEWEISDEHGKFNKEMYDKIHSARELEAYIKQNNIKII